MALRCVRSFLALWGVWIVLGADLREPLSVVGFAVMYVLFGVRREDMDPRASARPIRLLAVAYALFGAAGALERLLQAYRATLFRAGSFLIALLGLWLLWDALLPLAADRALRALDRAGARPAGKPVRGGAALLLRVPGLVCLAAWFPFFLYEYPGIVSPDGIVQVGQLLGAEPLSDHHPILHTWTIGLLMRVGSLFTGDRTDQLAFYTFGQLAFFAFCCGRAVKKLARELGPAAGLLALAFYALLSFHGVYAVYVLKDLPFCGFLLLFTIAVYDAALPGGGHAALRGWRAACFVLAGLGFALYRSNGLYAFLGCVPFLVLERRSGGKPLRVKRGLLAEAGFVLAVVVLYKGVLLPSLGIPGSDLAEKVHIPMQQVARVLVEGRELTARDRALIDRAVDTTWIRELYVPDYADNIKELMRAGDLAYIEAHPAEYLGLWLRLGLRYPGDYLLAYLDQTRCLWYPAKEVEIAMIDGVYPNGLGLEWRPLIGGPAIVKAKELLLKTGSMVPGAALFWSMGFYFWALLFLAALSLARRRTKRGLSVLLPSGMLYLTLFVALPLADFRYVYPMAVCLPLWLLAV